MVTFTAIKRLSLPCATALTVTPPVDVSERLVEEREAAEEDLGAGFHSSRITLHITPVGINIGFLIVVRRILTRLLNLGEESVGGVADRGEDGGVGDEMCFARISMDTADLAVECSSSVGYAFNVSLKVAISYGCIIILRLACNLRVSKKAF
ncbi:ABC transporter permease subunit [Babesia caballi]|uniref:ABC transporter permease subunit n=1 Tax=Babesia caballi TaxID=5871 RepID=A0AAV4LWH7_BABCB|nr:ABC transporter permease subunit [Babesia caballi]